MTQSDQTQLTPSRQRLVVALLLAFVLVVAGLVIGANVLFKSSKPYTEMSFSNPDDAKAALPGALISSTEWGESRGWIVWSQEGHKNASQGTLRTAWFGSKKCFWVSTDENRVQSYDPEPDNSCNPKNIPNLKVPQAVADQAIANVGNLQQELQTTLKGVPSNKVPFGITAFVVKNWRQVAAPTNIVQPTDGVFIYYVPVRNVPVKELTASGNGTQPVTDSCLTVTTSPQGSTVETAESCDK